MHHMDLGLHRVHSALAALDLASLPYPCAQIVGTNGKGSTSTFLAEVLTASGVRTGLFTSPHFLSPRERILVDGRQLPESDWLAAAEAVLRVSEDVSPARRLTYFELVTVMAVWLFRENGCEAAVIEAGLGGAHDATTALAHDLTVYTPIGLDHERVIGPTLTDIARDKAGAMRQGIPAVSARQEPRAMAVLTGMARRVGAPFLLADDLATQFGQSWPHKPVMLGPHQADNLRLALAAHHLLGTGCGLPQDAAAMERAARTAFIPGRLQLVPGVDGQPDFILDGAHNESGLQSLNAALRDLDIRPSAIIFACLADKDFPAMLPLVRSLTDGPVFVPGLDVQGREMDPAELARLIGPQAQPVADMAEALRRVEELEGTVLICGSLYLLAEAFRLHPQWLRASAR
ncbi:MAG: dihydrofolate synthase / folylpolyglutamate [Desulfovibrionaceae bacterium]|nr:MAG: dihydrofolate synthase / folylpolyglutamate [Desulfovibrionaceae bacterium]